MKSYKDRNGCWWTPAERTASLKKTNAAIAAGTIPPASTLGCSTPGCGQRKGIIQYHNDDYSDPVKYLRAFCWRCHMMFHQEHRFPGQVSRYFEEVKAGKKYPPIYISNFKILEDDHGIPCYR